MSLTLSIELFAGGWCVFVGLSPPPCGPWTLGTLRSMFDQGFASLFFRIHLPGVSEQVFFWDPEVHEFPEYRVHMEDQQSLEVLAGAFTSLVLRLRLVSRKKDQKCLLRGEGRSRLR